MNKVYILLLITGCMVLLFFSLKIMCSLPTGLEENNLRLKILNKVNKVVEEYNEKIGFNSTIYVRTNSGSVSLPCRCINPLTVYVYGFSRDYEKQKMVIDNLRINGNENSTIINLIFYGEKSGERNKNGEEYTKFDRINFEVSGQKFRQVTVQY